MFTACMGIAMCKKYFVWLPFQISAKVDTGGDHFTDIVDQEAVIDILAKTEADHARPTAAIQQQLMKTWGWMKES
jgi:hypothetical protein